MTWYLARIQVSQGSKRSIVPNQIQRTTTRTIVSDFYSQRVVLEIFVISMRE